MRAAEQILFRERQTYGDIRRFSLRIGSGFGGTTEVNEAGGFLILED